MPTIIAGRVRLHPEEKKLMEACAGESINPTTVEELNAWVDALTRPDVDDTPEIRLNKAIIEDFRVINGKSLGSFVRRQDNPSPVTNIR